MKEERTRRETSPAMVSGLGAARAGKGTKMDEQGEPGRCERHGKLVGWGGAYCGQAPRD